MAPKEDFDKYTFSPLSASSDEDVGFLSHERQVEQACSHPRRSSYIKALYLVIGFLLVLISSIFIFHEKIFRDRALAVWSPANQAVRYRTATFASDFAGRSPYIGVPSKEKDLLWEALYNFGNTGISESEALKLLNATVPAPNDPTKYVVQLEVFHLLHCLNMLRKALYPDEYQAGWTYYDDGTVNHNSVMGLHLDHCINVIRQSIMCNADITPITFEYSKDNNYKISPRLAATHTCRDFDMIADWAKERQIRGWLDGDEVKHAADSGHSM